ncbi:MAG: riboflavin synthase [Candidatus Eisenbacteria bacterium]|nr:riboflavin synthase [Candidatus Eisenbacteria bacterium]
MFTGLIEELAALLDVDPFPGGRRLRVRSRFAPEGLAPGDSVALDGICLTVERCEARSGTFTAAAVEETLRRTTAGAWRRGRTLHLERALAAHARLGGHLVQGHVDGIGRVVRAGRMGGEFVLHLTLPAELRRYVVQKGSIAIDGISLTVAEARRDRCHVHLIPETLARTRVGSYRPGERVNLEVDLIAKYVEALIGRRGERR